MPCDESGLHRRSVRLKGYDYSQEGAYFVTICTRNHALLFRDETIRGIAEQCWMEIPCHFPHVGLDEWVLMPNHLHGILVLSGDRGRCRGTACRAPTRASERFGRPTPGSLPTIIRSFKAATTRRVNVLRGGPRMSVWQRNYYERVIRDEDELNRLRQYVLDNPVQWEGDGC